MLVVSPPLFTPLEAPVMARTVRINGNVNFLALDAYMDALLQQKGFQRLERRGSTSWIDPTIQPADAAVKFKLCFFGPRDIKFGVREEFLTEIGLTASQINCPDSYEINGVDFVGFTVQNDQAGRGRIASTLANFN